MTDIYQPLYDWAVEREAIRIRREAACPPPWTADPILAKWRFCNVRREDDRVTVWIDDHIRKPFAGHPHLWFMLCIARVVNWPDTLADLMSSQYDAGWPGHGWSKDQFFRCLDDRTALGHKVFTGAYTITAPPKGGSKARFVADVTLGNLWKNRIHLGRFDDRSSLRGTHEALMQFDGWGPFMAYQAVVDMRFCPALLGRAHDKLRWAAAGPGTLRGLNRIYGRPLNASVSPKQTLVEIRDIYACFKHETGIDIDLSDIPNILCETDKYLRVKNGEGTPRQRYKLEDAVR